MDAADLQKHIITFIAEIEDCARSTSYASDRPIYNQDIATAASWLVKLNQGVAVADVIGEINSKQTDKMFGDYWRQGEWGSREATALERLRTVVS